MDILGASLFLRSKALIVMALIDAFISAVITSIIFYIIQNSWVKDNHIAILEDNIDGLFSFNDLFTLSFASILIVLVAVIIVVLRKFNGDWKLGMINQLFIPFLTSLGLLKATFFKFQGLVNREEAELLREVKGRSGRLGLLAGIIGSFPKEGIRH